MAILNVYQLMAGIEKYVVSGAVKGLTSVAWHDDEGAFTDGTTIHLPRPDALWNEEQLLLWRYKAEHELGHEDAINSCPHWKAVMVEKKKDARYKEDGLLWWIANLISDHVQEKNRVGEMVGRDEVLLHGRASFLKNMVFKEVKKKLTGDEVQGMGLFLWDTQARTAWNKHIDVPSMDKEALDLAAKIERESGVMLAALKNEQDVFEAAVKVRKLFPEVSNNNNFMNAKGAGEGEGKPGSTSVKGKGKKGKNGGVKSDSAIPFLPNGGHSEAPKAVSYDYAKGDGSYKARTPKPLGKGHTPSVRHMECVKGLVQRTNLPAKVRSYLMAMKREKSVTGYRSGKLDTSRLTDAVRGRDDIFRRVEPVRMVNSAVSLLVDSSGSMSGSAFQSACASALMLAEALQGVGCKVEIAGFTETSELIHDVWLPFGQRFVRENVLLKMGAMAHSLCNNADGENILYAYNRLLAQKEERKILIVLSDGEPSACGPEGHTMGVGQFTKNVCETVEKDKRVMLVGLGMSGYSPKRFYKNAYKVEYGQPLEGVLLNIVKDAVLKKG